MEIGTITWTGTENSDHLAVADQVDRAHRVERSNRLQRQSK